MNVLSLCSGGAGLELGVHLAADRLRLPTPVVVAYCEREAAALNVLAARMEDGSLARAPVWFDLRSLDGRALRGHVDLVTAGYPCQPDSLAGARGGADDERWLWDEVWRVVREVGSRYLFVENVPGHLSGTFGRVLGDLAAGGWAAEWDCVPAAAVGAPHLRDRVFCLAADPNVDALRVEPERDQRRGRGARAPEREDAVAVDDGGERPAADADRQRLEDERVGGVFDQAGAAQRHDADRCASARDAPADADHESAGAEHRLEQGQRSDVAAGSGTAVTNTARRGRDRAVRDLRGLQLRGGGKEAWDVHLGVPEPVVRRVDDGMATGVDGDRLFVLGNGVVPQAAAEAFVILWRRMHGVRA